MNDDFARMAPVPEGLEGFLDPIAAPKAKPRHTVVSTREAKDAFSSGLTTALLQKGGARRKRGAHRHDAYGAIRSSEIAHRKENRDMKRILQALVQLALLAMALAIAPAAQAAFQTTYTFDVDYCSNGCLFGATGGTVTLTQNGTNDVTVTVNLTGVDFHDQGLTSFVWNLDPTVTNVSTANLGNDELGNWTSLITGPVHEDGAGNFDYAVNCPNCGPQAGGVDVASITFDVLGTGLTTDSFHFLSSGGSPPAYFAAAVFNTTDTTCTGVIGADGGTTARTGGSNDGTGRCATPVQETPEPHSLALAGLGLLAVGFIRRRNTR